MEAGVPGPAEELVEKTRAAADICEDLYDVRMGTAKALNG